MKRMREFLLINLGLFFTACGIHFFKIPNHFATGGVSGLAIIAENFIENLSVGLLMLLINIVFLLLGLVLVGWDFTRKTLYSSIALSGMVWLLDYIYPMSGPMTTDTLLELIFSILIPAVGSALMTSDFLITVLSGIVFGIQTGLYSILGLILKGFVIDTVIEGFNLKKQVVIVSEKPEPIRAYIVENIKRGATIHTAYGAWSNEEKHVITSVMSRKQALDLRHFIRKTDKNAFITITNTSEIIGKGFRSI